MRLSAQVIQTLQRNIKQSFGNVEVYLFGSMLDDTKKGGDIDLAIKTQMDAKEFRKRKISFLKNLMMEDFLYQIDVVEYHTKDPLFAKEIQKEAILIKL